MTKLCIPDKYKSNTGITVHEINLNETKAASDLRSAKHALLRLGYQDFHLVTILFIDLVGVIEHGR